MRFVKLTQTSRAGFRLVLINVDKIDHITPSNIGEPGSVIWLGKKTSLVVMEKLQEIEAMLNTPTITPP